MKRAPFPTCTMIVRVSAVVADSLPVGCDLTECGQRAAAYWQMKPDALFPVCAEHASYKEPATLRPLLSLVRQ